MDNDLKLAINASLKAGEIIMQYYCDDYEIKEKGYHNPVTTADNEADSYLKSTLMSARPQYGWLSEETVDSKERLHKERVWIVDPLDGTKEFVNKNGEFTVNIALVEKGIPVLGIVSLPATKEVYIGAKGVGAFKEIKGIRTGIRTKTVNPRKAIVAISRSHQSKEDLDFL